MATKYTERVARETAIAAKVIAGIKAAGITPHVARQQREAAIVARMVARSRR